MTDLNRVVFPPDGAWLNSYRQSVWEPVLNLEVEVGTQTLDVALPSCFRRSDGDVFCILRSIDITQDTIAYLVGFVPNFERGRLYQIAARTEHFNGRTVGRDLIRVASHVWDSSSHKGVAAMIDRLDRYSSQNNWSAQPDYLAAVLGVF